jgi:hypothetical protein
MSNPFKFKATVDETLAEAEKVLTHNHYLSHGDSVLVCAGYIDKLPGIFSHFSFVELCFTNTQ